MARKAKAEIIDIPGFIGVRIRYSKQEPPITFWASSKRELKASLAKAMRVIEAAKIELEAP